MQQLESGNLKLHHLVTYGNNGFFLKFDNSANMGLDSSGQFK